MGFGIAKGFGFESALEDLIYEQLQGQEQAAEKVVDFARTMLENVKGGLVAGIGLLILFYTVIKIFSQIESSFNRIWGITKSRSLGRKITDYFSLILICPVFLIVSSAVAVFLASEVRSAAQEKARACSRPSRKERFAGRTRSGAWSLYDRSDSPETRSR